MPDWPAYRPVDPGPFYVDPCTPDGAPDVLDVRPWDPKASGRRAVQVHGDALARLSDQPKET